jgi:hypothetical protein
MRKLPLLLVLAPTLVSLLFLRRTIALQLVDELVDFVVVLVFVR